MSSLEAQQSALPPSPRWVFDTCRSVDHGVPIASVVTAAGAGSNDPVRVSFLINAAAPAFDPISGARIVAAIGRNDVIL